MAPYDPLVGQDFFALAHYQVNIITFIFTFLMVNKGIVYGCSENGPPWPLGVPGQEVALAPGPMPPDLARTSMKGILYKCLMEKHLLEDKMGLLGKSYIM